MSIGHAFLGLLDREPQHGYAMKQAFDQWFGLARPVPFGQVYATLARLERKELAEVAMVEAGDGPERRRYAITSGGVEELERWIATPQSADDLSLSDLFRRTVVALLSGRSPNEVLDGQRAVHLQRMRALRRDASTASIEMGLAADYLIAHLQADLDWIELAAARLEDARGTRRP